MPHIGTVYRFVKYKKPAPINYDALNYAVDADDKFRLDYGMACPNVDSGYAGVAKYNKPQPIYDEGLMDLVMKFTFKHFAPFLMGSRFSSVDAVIENMDLNKSPGWPWNLWYKTKRCVVDALKCAGVFYQMLDEFMSSLATDLPLWCFWQASQKYEMRPLEKLRQIPASIRNFMSSSIEHIILMNQFCLEMNNRFYRAGASERICSFVGRSKFNGGFHSLVIKLGRFNLVFCCDGSQYDSSLFRGLMWRIAHLRWDWFSEQDKTPLRKVAFFVLYAMAIFALVVCELGDLILKTTGNPSGFSNTIVDNTIALWMLILYAFIYLARIVFKDRIDEHVRALHVYDKLVDPAAKAALYDKEINTTLSGLCGYEAFMRTVELALNGDDSVISVSSEILSWFNAKELCKVMQTLNMKFTCEEENGLAIRDLEFLSQRVALVNGMYLPYPEFNKVVSSLVLGGTTDPRFCLLRAFALRIESWGSLKLRSFIQGFIEQMMVRYNYLLSGVVQIPGTQVEISWDDIWKSYMTDDELWKLYTGKESTCKKLFSRVKRTRELVDCVMEVPLLA